MRRLVLGILCLGLAAGAVYAQPSDGDIVVANFRDPTTPGSYGPGSVLAINPNTGKIFTIAAVHTTVGTVKMGPNWVEMASDNTDLVIPSLPTGFRGIYFHEIDPAGNIVATLVADANVASSTYMNACDLDYDGTWFLAGRYGVWAYNENTKAYSTLFTASPARGTHNGFVIDHGLPNADFCVGIFTSGSSSTPNLMAADRNGYVSTISTAGPSYLSGIKVDYMTGDYLCSAFGPRFNGTGGEFSRTTKAGVYTTLNDGVTSMYRANAIYLTKDHLAWILTYDWRTTPIPTVTNNYVCSVYKVDYQGVFITQYVYSSTLTRGNFAPAGITEYGCRHVVCNGSGKPGTKVKVSFSSRKSSDAGKAYQLAASFGYTNGLKFANGEYLDLTFDVLFYMSANNLVPSIFQNFGGLLDAKGNATAWVNVPSFLPSGLGVPVYVSGIVIDPRAPGGVTTVGNTHWFVLN